MKVWLVKMMALALLGGATTAAAADCPVALDFYKRPLMGEKPVHLCEEFRGQVVLIVNTASKCAYTAQYEGLEEVYSTYRERGLTVAGFPSNDFGAQEPGTEKQVRDFCRLTYGVQFPMFAKTRVRGNDAEPLYQHLAEVTGESPRWNFHKYLLDRQGRVVASFPSRVEPEEEKLIAAIEELL